MNLFAPSFSQSLRVSLRKAWLPVMVLLVSGGLHAGEVREFRNSAGQSFQGELIAVEGDSVTIKATDGRQVKAGAALFSPEDQTFFKEWGTKNKPKVAYQFKAAFAPKRISAERSEEGATKVTEEKWTYQVTLESQANASLQGVEVRYRVYKLTAPVVGANRDPSDLRRQGKYGYLEGVEKLPVMTLRKALPFTTKPLSVNKSDLKGGWVYTNGSEEKREEDLAGIWIKVFHEGKEVFELLSNPTKLQDLTW